MTEHNRISIRAKAIYFLTVQASVLFCAVIVVLVLHKSAAAISVLLGGLASIIPNILFAFWLFSDTRARAAHKILLRLFIGEVGKLVLSGLLFVLIIKLIPVSAVMVVAGFIVATLGFLVTPVFFKG